MWEPYATDLRELLGDKAVIACMPSTRIQKFKRLFPKAKQATDAAREKSKRWLDGLTETQRAALATWRHSGSAARVQLEFFASLDGSRLDDPALGDFVSMAEALTPQLREAYNRFGVHISVPASERRTPPKGYALLDHMNLRIASHGATLDHVTLYLNAAYAARPKGSK